MRALFLVVAGGALACGPGTSVHSARGVVQEVQPAYGQVVIAHEAVEGLMPAMTMNFDVADPALLERLEPGQVIDFELEFTGRSYRVLTARVVGHGDADTPAVSLAGLRDEAEPAPGFALTDQNGDALALADLRGHAVLLDFIYTRCPGPCPILTGTHVEVYERLDASLREHVRFVSISLDPAHDTPAELRRYARARGADRPGWFFLTGPPETVEPVLAAYGVGASRRDDGEIDHLVATFLIDAQGRIARRFVGLEHAPEQVTRELARLAAAAGSPRGASLP